DNNRYTIKKGTLNVENLAFAISGRVVSGEPYSVNLDIKGKDLNVKSFVSLLPDAYKEDIADYSSNGIFYMNATVSGNVDRNSMPHISLDFGVEDGIIERNGTELRLNNVFVTGNFSNGDKNNSSTSTLVFENFDILMGRSHLEGRYKMENFKKPSVTLQASGEIEMEQVKEFFDIDTLQLFSGLITADILFEGQLNSLEEFTVQDFRNAKTEGKIRITDGKLKIENNPYNFNEINGRFTFKNNDIRIDSLICIINDNDFLITGYFKNILSFLMVEGQELSIDGKISSSNLDVVKLFNLDEQAGEDNDGYHFPDNIRVNAQVDIRNFRYRRFEATGVFGKVQYMNKTLAVSPVTFSTMDGKLKTTGTIAQEKDNSFTTKCYTVLTGIDIKKLFWTFRNFDQDFILDSHLKGSIFADLSYSSAWDSTLSVDEKSIVAEGEIIIDNGELIGFEPMEKLSKFIALDELMHIKFETLKNDIIIKDRKVTIPQMNIKSSAFDIELSGEHTFDNDINYKIKVLLSDILARKAKKAKKENEEFGQIEDDGLGRTSIYISITGNVDDYKVSYDTKKVKDHIKESLKEEKNNLKQILNEEFGWFKKDSAVIKNKDPEQDNNSNNNFTIRWDEDEDEENNNGNTEEEDDDW
ncbi:MAG: AsmA-like C-terminal region-containing protein, partial [Bacteroidota bacterium]